MNTIVSFIKAYRIPESRRFEIRTTTLVGLVRVNSLGDGSENFSVSMGHSVT